MDTGFLMEEWWAPILMTRQEIIIFGGEDKCIELKVLEKKWDILIWE